MSIPSHSTPSKHRKVLCHKYVGKEVWVSHSGRGFGGETGPKWLHGGEVS